MVASRAPSGGSLRQLHAVPGAPAVGVPDVVDPLADEAQQLRGCLDGRLRIVGRVVGQLIRHARVVDLHNDPARESTDRDLEPPDSVSSRPAATRRTRVSHASLSSSAASGGSPWQIAASRTALAIAGVTPAPAVLTITKLATSARGCGAECPFATAAIVTGGPGTPHEAGTIQ